ncbi:MAG: hypothetical protein MK008_06680 [Bdellovibrionales bacterium]|nr:hypothetical protein [Bdellovibrionales bacterium]
MIILAWFFSSLTLACPNISGLYTCYTENQTEPLKVTQQASQHGERVHLDFEHQDNLDFLADGQLRIIEKDLTQDNGNVIGKAVIETHNLCRGPMIEANKLEKNLYYELGLMVFEHRVLIEHQNLGLQITNTNIFTDIDGRRLKESNSYFCQKNQ